MADTRNALLPEKCRHQDTRNALALEKYRGNGECETGKEKWKEVGMGHKSVRQLYFIEDEMDAVDVYNRLRSHLLIIEYPLKLNPAFRSCDSVSILAL